MSLGLFQKKESTPSMYLFAMRPKGIGINIREQGQVAIGYSIDEALQRIKVPENVSASFLGAIPCDTIMSLLVPFSVPDQKVKVQVPSEAVTKLLEATPEAKNEPVSNLFGQPAVFLLNALIEHDKLKKSEIPIIRRIVKRLQV